MRRSSINRQPVSTIMIDSILWRLHAQMLNQSYFRACISNNQKIWLIRLHYLTSTETMIKVKINKPKT